MSSYPPPPPPPFAPDWKAQQRAMRDQARLQARQFRQQQRALRRRSLVGPILLIGFGVLFLLVEFGHVDPLRVFAWLGTYWPVMLIISGALLLLEWALDQRHAQIDPATGRAIPRPRYVGGGVIWLLVLLALVGSAAHVAHHHLDALDGNGFNFGDFNRALGEPHDSDDVLARSVPATGTVTFDNPRGDVTVTGTSDDGQMHVAIHKQVYALSESEASAKSTQIRPFITGEDQHLTVNVPEITGGHADLSVQLPRTVSVIVTAGRGQVRVSGIHAAVLINGGRGNVDVSAIDGSVTAHLHSSDAAFSAHSITGPVVLDGKTGDLNISGIDGTVALNGDFFGATHMEHINNTFHFKSSRTDFQAARLDGEIELDTGSELHADQLLGPVTLATRDRNITLDRVQGAVQLTNRNGSVTVASTAPLGDVNIDNHHGSVELSVPGSAGFTVLASTKDGNVENDFALAKSGPDDRPQMQGTVGRGGVSIHILTSDGDVTLRKNSAAPLPPLPPLPSIISVRPPAPQAAPKLAPIAPKAPRAPKAPAPSPDF